MYQTAVELEAALNKLDWTLYHFLPLKGFAFSGRLLNLHFMLLWCLAPLVGMHLLFHSEFIIPSNSKVEALSWLAKQHNGLTYWLLGGFRHTWGDFAHMQKNTSIMRILMRTQSNLKKPRKKHEECLKSGQSRVEGQWKLRQNVIFCRKAWLFEEYSSSSSTEHFSTSKNTVRNISSGLCLLSKSEKF